MRTMPRIVVVGLLLAFAAFVTLTIVFALGSRSVACEVCVDFHGRTQCRSATGNERHETIRVATDNACAYVASGRLEMIQCNSLPPSRVECRDR